MPPTLVINVAGLGRDLVWEVPCLRALAGRGALVDLEPVLPATTCPMQATLTTGVPPGRSRDGPGHGIVASGLYFLDTAEVRFWEQSARLLTAPRMWERRSRKSEIENRKAARPKVAMLFWQQSMYGSADVLLTPKPVHGPEGLIQDVYSRPADLYRRLADGESALDPGRPRGPFNLMDYWGPLAGRDPADALGGASGWIADATLAVWRDARPDLCLTYLPHLDYSGHRDGPDADAHRTAAASLEALLAPLLAAAEADGARVLVLSEYAFLPVARPVAPNRALRDAGLLAVRDIDGREYLYPGDCRAFAMVDNQVAHVYFPASPDLDVDGRKARRCLARLDGVARVLTRADLQGCGLDHPRSGDLVLLAEPDAHFTYYWWLDDAKAPAFAPTVDIHAKPGFDAAELFVEPPAHRVPVSAERVRGSHGLVLEDGRGWGVLIASPVPDDLAGRDALHATEVARLMG
jgi:predicted AlkP superfamily pyrophosphatase or phosphodiesterase